MKRDTGGDESWLAARLRGARRFLSSDVWSAELTSLPTFRALFYKTSRVLYLAVRGFVEDNCLFRASALTYITVLSIVPMLAFVFSIAKGLGAYETLVTDTLYPFLDSTFGAMPEGVEPIDPEEKGGVAVRQAIEQLLAFVKDTNFASLGLFGLLVLLFAVIKLCGAVEKSLNDIWGIAKPRSLIRKFSDYLAMVVIVPVFLVTATGLTTALQSPRLLGGLRDTLHLGGVIEFVMGFSSLAAMWLGFTFVYLFMPNTRTRVSSALVGGLVGGTLWHLAQIGHVRFQLGIANYNAIYSSFAAFPVFLVWLYFSWVTVLLGAEFAFAHQNEPSYRQIARSRHHDHSFREVLALRMMTRIGVAFLGGRLPYGTDTLAAELGVPERSVERVAHDLQEQHILARIEDDLTETLLPSRDLERIRIKDVIDALKGTSGPVDFPPSDDLDREVDRTLREFESECATSPLNRTIRELVIARLESEADADRDAIHKSTA